MSGMSMQHYIGQMLQTAWVKKGMVMYSATKQAHPLLETTLDTVEGSLLQAAHSINRTYEGGMQRVQSTYDAVHGRVAHVISICITALVLLTQIQMQLLSSALDTMCFVLSFVHAACLSAVNFLKTNRLHIGQYSSPAAVQEIYQFGQVVTQKLTMAANSMFDNAVLLVESWTSVKVEISPEAPLLKRLSALVHSLFVVFSSLTSDKLVSPLSVRISFVADAIMSRFLQSRPMEEENRGAATVVSNGQKPEGNATRRQRNTVVSASSSNDGSAH